MSLSSNLSGGGSKGRRSGQMMNMFKKPFTTLNRTAAGGGRSLGSQQSLGGSKPDFVQELANEGASGASSALVAAGGSENNLSAVGQEIVANRQGMDSQGGIRV